MKIKISYFGRLKNFKPYQIPVSTAIWDPKWFHDNKGHEHIFRYHNGIWFGFRCERLKPGYTCDGLCRGNPCPENPATCLFLANYYRQLQNLDFASVIEELGSIAKAVQAKEQFAEEPEIILMVYETEANPCSERWKLIQWFADNGYILENL